MTPKPKRKPPSKTPKAPGAKPPSDESERAEFFVYDFNEDRGGKVDALGAKGSDGNVFTILPRMTVNLKTREHDLQIRNVDGRLEIRENGMGRQIIVIPQAGNVVIVGTMRW